MVFQSMSHIIVSASLLTVTLLLSNITRLLHEDVSSMLLVKTDKSNVVML